VYNKSCEIRKSYRTIPLAFSPLVVAGTLTIWAKAVTSYSTPEDVAAPEAAVQHALSVEWFDSCGCRLTRTFWTEGTSRNPLFRARVV
jgi:hypothetical protein